MKKMYILLIALFLGNGAMAQWYAINPNDSANYGSMYFTDASTGYVTKDYAILKTTDGALTWIQQYQNNNGWGGIGSLFFTDANTGYAIQLNGLYSSSILKTSNGGSQWIVVAQIPEQVYSLFFTDANTGYAAGAGYSRKIFKTIDGGASWTLQYYQDQGWMGSLFFVDGNIGYASGGYTTGGWPFPQYHRTMLKTIDGGLNWITIIDTLGRPTSVFFTSADTGYMAGPEILKTEDGGITWFEIMNGAAAGGEWGGVWFTDANTGYASNIITGNKKDPGDFTIIKTTDGGTNWFVQTVIGEPFYGSGGVFFPVADTGYCITAGRPNGYGILKTENGGGFPVGSNDQNITPSRLTMCPNPAHTSITLTTPAKGSLYIHNTRGQAILQQQITSPTTTIDVSGLKSGVYFVRVTGEKGVQVGKVIKQ